MTTLVDGACLWNTDKKRRSNIVDSPVGGGDSTNLNSAVWHRLQTQRCKSPARLLRAAKPQLSKASIRPELYQAVSEAAACSLPSDSFISEYEYDLSISLSSWAGMIYVHPSCCCEVSLVAGLHSPFDLSNDHEPKFCKYSLQTCLVHPMLQLHAHGQGEGCNSCYLLVG